MVNHKGEQCPYEPITCQEGFCNECCIYQALKDPTKFVLPEEGKMKKQDVAKRHLIEALYAALAEADGHADLGKRLHAQAKLRLIDMTDEELWDLAKITALPPERPVELRYKEYKSAIEELKETAGEWIKDLRPKRDTGRTMNNRILIIESEPTLRQELVSAFTQADFIVDYAKDYPEAQLKLNESKPDLIVMDTTLPTSDGFEACSQLRRTFGIPVVLLGEDSSDDVWVRVTEVDADLYETKPCRYIALVARVKAVLRRYRLISLGSSNDPAYGK